MNPTISIQIAVYLLAIYGVANAHVADFHFRTPTELHFEKQVERDQENKRARETISSDSATLEEKQEAFATLYENGGIS